MDADVAARTLRLLTLLQSAPSWSAESLARRLGTSMRTLRRDLARLQQLGYTVISRPGPGGHYRLGPGTKLPPMTFDDDEVVALVAGLRMAEQGVAGEAASRALVKVRQVLPHRLATVAAHVADHSESLPDADQPLEEALRPLTVAAAADRLVRFDYVDAHGRATHRRVDSMRCLYSRGRWYVMGYDLDRDDWRVFRLDRVRNVSAARPALRRDPPAADLAAWLRSDFGRAPHADGS